MGIEELNVVDMTDEEREVALKQLDDLLHRAQIGFRNSYNNIRCGDISAYREYNSYNSIISQLNNKKAILLNSQTQPKM